MDIEKLLEKPYWIVDILPKQVAKHSNGQYFAIEQYYLSEPQSSELRKKYAHLVLKLNCYYDILALDDFAQGEDAKNSVRIIIKNEDILIVSNKDDTYMTIYNPAECVLTMIQVLAAAEGLYVWKPKEE